MEFNKPVLVDVTSFDATEDKRIDFFVDGGNLFTKGIVCIVRKDISDVVYKQLTVDLQSSFFVLKKNTLVNNKDYFISLSVGDGETWSPSSNWDYFSCFKKATLSISGIEGGVVKKQNLTIEGNYDQPNDPMRSYRILVLDENRKKISDSGNVYRQTIKEDIYGLVNGLSYEIWFSTVSQSGIETKLPPVPFIAKYNKLNANSEIDLSCDKITGDVIVKAIISKQKGEYYKLGENGEKIVTNEKVPFVSLKDNNKTSSIFADLSSGKNALSYSLSGDFRRGFSVQLWFCRKGKRKFELLKLEDTKNNFSITVSVDRNKIEALCSNNGVETIYGIDTEEISENENVNETLIVSFDNFAINMKHLKGGSVEA